MSHRQGELNDISASVNRAQRNPRGCSSKKWRKDKKWLLKSETWSLLSEFCGGVFNLFPFFFCFLFVTIALCIPMWTNLMSQNMVCVIFYCAIKDDFQLSFVLCWVIHKDFWLDCVWNRRRCFFILCQLWRVWQAAQCVSAQCMLGKPAMKRSYENCPTEPVKTFNEHALYVVLISSAATELSDILLMYQNNCRNPSESSAFNILLQ